jgi:hypothetical protein
MKQTPLQRIQRIINFYYKRGCNKESVNTIYKKILKARYETNTEFTQWIDKLKRSEIDTIDYDTYLRYDKKQLLEIFKKENKL